MQKSSFVHLAVDWDFANLEGVVEARRNKAAENVGGFAGKLRERSVPTVWISLTGADVDFKAFWATEKWETRGAKPRVGNQLAALGLGNMPVKADENIFVMPAPDVFKGGIIGDWVKEEFGVKGLIVSGWPADPCLQPTLEGAVAAGFNVHAVHDHMPTKQGCEKKLSIEEWWAKQKIAATQPADHRGPKGTFRTMSTKEVINFFNSLHL